ncbi:M23 family metallopeptidase [Fulvivirga sedimenti]|uniref:M23 family metallopeptidase n=1 Tax=Fulvivirga sedimenti TaxID=2879465 RepID=A0A9X1HMQ0_9BACT|nr:M23 family metallopeptidase [Fulvivirga sedimenti]MCA6074306.1 M23 family metallopeptidase [Fulvivirga sedimenti]
MATLKFVSTTYTVLHLILLVLLLVVLIWRLRSWANRDRRIKSRNTDQLYWIRGMKFFLILALFLCAIALPVNLFIVSPFASLVPSWVLLAISLTVLLLAITEVLLFSSYSKKLLNSKSQRFLLMLSTILVGLPGLVLLSNIPAVYSYPEKHRSLIVDMPVKGTWSAGHAGGTTTVNYHCAYASQKYAMDIVKVDEGGRFFSGDGTQIEDFFTLGEPIYAPVSGTVVQVQDSLPNEAVSFEPNNPSNPAGNHVVIRMEEGVYVFLAHMMPGSIVVKVGDRVKSGDMLGKAGNSGNTSWPHLHMHIQNSGDLNAPGSQGLPYRFSTINRKRIMFWHKAEDAYLVRNDLFSDVQ